MYLLDTNIISEIRRLKQGKCDPNVARWVMKISNQLMYTSPIVMMELERGILAKEQKDPAQGVILRRWFNEVVQPAFTNKILPIDQVTAQICARLHFPDHAPENDAWIAATALQHNLILVTRNIADFQRTSVKLLNPFMPIDE
ncbi:twitching motility protein PilT [Gallibacterium salpingitidis]|uniref:type II toxin-antitoxin system VapC family toxin n=1 Tax=Gallibacterium salpingitidis TaxID=505341 RepID=UPI00080542AC|nr:type II toxin-antitoxin system VapC family toxin [Gallibacterium salpingitidis]OBX07798.1 twitching motility protein PilT [Gallibacterium salpingitidis]WKT00877.1 type II toxin-antitoxin system VapC family toxin [Gallibacterium salpingitidis]